MNFHLQADSGIRGRGLTYLAQLDEKRAIWVGGVFVEGVSTVSDQTLVEMLKGAAAQFDVKLRAWEVSAVAGSKALKACVHDDPAVQGWYCMLAVAGKRSGLAYMFLAGANTGIEAEDLVDDLVRHSQFLR